MQEKSAHKVADSVTQARRPYSPRELELIESMAPRRVCKSEIVALFPDRTVSAVKQQIVAARHRLGLIEADQHNERRRDDTGFTILDPDEPGFEDGWEARNARAHERGSAALLAALIAA